ncbi:hypothetical protein HK405_004651 [Cladochytrium tenue]|nr:hypothetical protein HK405_004651 [Cladochytrium tenue]
MTADDHDQLVEHSTGLFGGAIEAWIPKTFVDSSNFRQVPDNQEVFVDLDTDQSIIVDLLQMEHEAEVPAVFHFWELADANSARDTSRILRVEQLRPGSDLPLMEPDTQITVVIGQQLVSKYRERTPESGNLVNVYVAVLRLPRVETDLVISYNHPVALGRLSSSRLALESAGSQPETAAVGGVSTTALGVLGQYDVRGMGTEEVMGALAELEGDIAIANFRRIVRSVAVKDWSLFAG